MSVSAEIALFVAGYCVLLTLLILLSKYVGWL
jgi:hypothetical protein